MKNFENKTIKLNTPLERDKIKDLKAGDMVSLSGSLLGARDAAHKRLCSLIENGKETPVNLKNETIFYLGPSPTSPGKRSGSIGPTTSARMDGLTEPLLKAGIIATIGKGSRSPEAKYLFLKYNAVYFIAPGGVAAYLATKVKKIETVAYDDLGPEAIFRITVEDFPLFVAYDICGGDVFTI